MISCERGIGEGHGRKAEHSSPGDGYGVEHRSGIFYFIF